MMSIIRRKLMMAAVQGSGDGTLPLGYSRLDYIASDGNQFFDTKVTGVNAEYIIECADIHQANDNWPKLFAGDTKALAPKLFLASYDTYKYRLIAETNKENGILSIALYDTRLNNGRHLISFKEGIITLDGEFIQDIGKKDWGNRSFYVFAGNEERQKIAAKIYQLKMYTNGLLVRDYVPCISDENKIGMFDLVNKRLYTSITTFPFIAGNPI